MTDLPLSVIEAGRVAYRDNMDLGHPQWLSAIYRAMQAADPDWVEMRAEIERLKQEVLVQRVMRERAERPKASRKQIAARTANETGSET